MFRRFAGKHLFLSLVVAVLLPVVGTAGDAYVADFLDIPVDARSLAFGLNQITLSRQPSGILGNPANVVWPGERQIEIAYGSLYGGLNSGLGQHQGVFLHVPLRGSAGFALAFVRLAVDDIPRYGDLGASSFSERLVGTSGRPGSSPLGYFSDSEVAFFAAFGRGFPVRIGMNWFVEKIDLFPYVGVDFKVLHQILDRFSARGAGFDIGAGLRVDLRQFSDAVWLGTLNVAWTGRDVGNTVLTWNNRVRESRSHSNSWGFAYQLELGRHVELGTFWQTEARRGSGFATGLEACYRGTRLMVGLRDKRPGFSLGLTWGRWGLSYGFRSMPLGETHRIDAIWSF